MRSGVGKNFKVESQQRPLGNLSFSQVMREAYPGAVYYYMACPFRILRVNYNTAEIIASPAPRYTTKPLTQIMVFPDLIGGLHKLMVGGAGFVAEADMQVSKRVMGLKEKRGPNEITHNYGVVSPHLQRPLQRLIRTTGVCWFFPEPQVMTDAVAIRILDAYCLEFAVHARDLGVGRFHVQQSPFSTGVLQGICIYDATHGSLHLSERLAANFEKIVRNARYAAEVESTSGLPNNSVLPLRILCVFTSELSEKSLSPGRSLDVDSQDTVEWVEVVAPRETAFLVTGTEAAEVKVIRYFFSPGGLKYQLKHENPEVRWTVEASMVQRIPAMTKILRYNPNTG
jgi:DEAD/DEAH box helicase domain-containing protein